MRRPFGPPPWLWLLLGLYLAQLPGAVGWWIAQGRDLLGLGAYPAQLAATGGFRALLALSVAQLAPAARALLGRLPPPRTPNADGTPFPRDAREQCARPRVPRDYRHPDSGTLTLTVSRIRTAEPARRRGYLARRISYLGTSYATYLGQVYASPFPARTDRVVPDSTVAPGSEQQEIARYPLTDGTAGNVRPCAFWHHRPHELQVRPNRAGPHDILLPRNRRDPATPLSGARRVLAAFGPPGRHGHPGRVRPRRRLHRPPRLHPLHHLPPHRPPPRLALRPGADACAAAASPRPARRPTGLLSRDGGVSGRTRGRVCRCEVGGLCSRSAACPIVADPGGNQRVRDPLSPFPLVRGSARHHGDFAPIPGLGTGARYRTGFPGSSSLSPNSAQRRRR
ncbi:alpha/beta hydrolase [Kitasatospora sp. NPDC086791]|uniref:alpha/beta hydrolase n=1 Tax=Kitasatospora sp. NPDC086791 TaxID=3155178 RepID=UPI00341739F3